MRKRVLSGLLVLCLVLSLAPTASAMTGVKVTKKGQVVDSITFKGVTVNAIYAPPDSISNYSSNSTYCCAAFVSKFYRQVYGVNVSNLVKNGGGPKVDKGSFSKTSAPQVGDVVHRKTSTSTHWSIVKKVDSKTVTLIEQNAWYKRSEAKARVGKTYDINDSAVTFYRYSGAGGESCNGNHTKGEYQFYEDQHPHEKYWKCANCGALFTDGSTEMVPSCTICFPPKRSETITLNPITIHDFSMYYDANGGTGEPPMEGKGTSDSSYTYTISSQKPVRSGYTFLGWSRDKDARTADYVPGSKITVTGMTTLYAVWEQNCDNGHSWTEWERAQEATCEVEGQDERACTVCGEVEIKSLPVLEHVWDDGTVTTPATETQEGTMTYTCVMCGSTRTEPIEKKTHTTHTWSQWDTVQETTCERTGKEQRVCTVCGKEETRTVDALSHHYELVEDGVDYERYRCANCGASYTEEKDGETEWINTLEKDASVGMSNFRIKNRYADDLFWDVGGRSWYHDNVATVYGMGLMKGTGDGIFSPNNNVTIAEAITLAARIHSIYHTGVESFVVYDGGNWYDPYVDYAEKNDIMKPYYIYLYTQVATREQFAHILSQALPEEELGNTVGYISFADRDDIRYIEQVRLLSGAGVITGIVEGERTYFKPTAPITRAEVAAVVGRMVQPGSRAGE